MQQIAIFPGTFDPITLGHEDLIARATKMFSNVIVAVAENTRKQPLFSLNQRIEMASLALAKYQNVQVKGFSNLLADFAQEQGASILLRGVRVTSDFEQELKLASMNRILNPNLETIFLLPSEKYAFIASSLVKEIASMGGDTSSFVNATVSAALRAKQ